jgi:tetratricopeptide (TPR) repeat protein
VGRAQQLADLEELLTAAATGEQPADVQRHLRLRPGTHHIALTGPPGIGKSALAFEAVRRNRDKFLGGIIGISLQDGKTFGDALIEMMHHLHIAARNGATTDLSHRERLVLAALRSLASRELPCLILLDSFEEVTGRPELETWLHFLCALPPEVVALVTSRSNPETMIVLDGPHCRWYEYPVSKMTDAELLTLFTDLASASGLDQRIHLDDSRQQAILREICTLLDGYPLGAELIFGTARSIGGKVYTPEAASRSLEEVRDELRSTPLAGILAVLEVSYRRLSPPARLLLAYLAAFKLPFSREQIVMLVAPETLSAIPEPVRLVREQNHHNAYASGQEMILVPQNVEEVAPALLAENWRAARDELVQASFMQFDGRVYTIHPQVRYFAMAHLPIQERHRVHRVVASYYYNLPQPGPDEWFAAFEHLEYAGEPQDLQEAVRVAVRASWALDGRGHAPQLQAMLRRAGVHASRLGDRTGAGQIECCLGAILRHLGQYTEAEACLRSSLAFHREQNEREEAGWALYELAMLFREEGNFRQAGVYAQEALTLFREVGNPRGEAWMQMVVGEVSRGYGAYYEALGHFELALANFRNLNNKEGLASTLRDRGTVYEALGRYTRALNDDEEALRSFNELGLREGQAWVLADMSVVYTDQGKLDQAEKMCGEAIAIFREQGIRRGEGWALRAMGDIVRERHDLSSARQYYEGALALFTSLGDRVDQARVLNALGALAFESGEYLSAQGLYEQAQIIAQEQEARQIDGRAWRGLGDVARVLHRLADAERSYHRALTIAIELDTPAERCAVLRRLGLLRQFQQRYQEALDCWVQALALDQRLGHPARADMQARVETLVTEQHLEETYAALCNQHSLV